MRGSTGKLAFRRKQTGQAARVKTHFLKAERQTTHRRRSHITSHLTARGESADQSRETPGLCEGRRATTWRTRASVTAFGVDQSEPPRRVVHFALNAASTTAAFITSHTCWLLAGAGEERQQLALTRPWGISD